MAKDEYDWTRCFCYAAASDVGMRRGNNQDSFAVHLASDSEQWSRQGHLFVVADGMGAHAAGELASKLATDHVPLFYQKQNEASPPEGLSTAIHGANQEIHRRGQENIEFHNMGTTCSAMLLLPQGAVVGHVGDSRVYRLRDGVLSQLTFDHSLIWEMRQGNGKPLDDTDDSLAGIPKNVITRSLGPHSVVDVDMEGPFPIEAGDTFLLCSDGLTGPLPDREIATILESLPPDEAAQMLVDLANMHGGPDNITVIVCNIVDERMATHNRSDQPINVGNGQQKKREVHPIVWGAICVLGLAGAALLATDRITPALILFSAAIVSGLAAMAAHKNVFGGPGVALSDEQQLGKGPYRSIEKLAPSDFCAQLAERLGAARNTVDGRDWEIDWDEFQRHQQAAEELVASGREADAIRSYAKAVHLLVSQARQQLRSGS